MKWISVEDRLPPMDEDVRIRYGDHDDEELKGKYTHSRRCMLAGVAGGNGYFGEGWAVADCDDVDSNLIIDPPTHWMPLPEAPKE